MKKIMLVLAMILIALISGCTSNSDKENKNESVLVAPENSVENNEILDKNNTLLENFNDNLNQIKFNSNLTDYEEKYLRYYEEKYPTAKIYHMKTQIYKCVGCYDIYFKKDREILKIKISNDKISQETTIRNELNLYIENKEMCTLFQGNWNTCPKVCTTDEKACLECAPAACEFDENKIVLKKVGEVCGGLTMGDCEYGYTCSYKVKTDEFGVCVKK